MAAGHGLSLLEVARVARGLTQEALARRAGTTQPTLSAYERGTKSPTLAVLDRLLASLDFELGLNDKVTFHEISLDPGPGSGPRSAWVPNHLWRLEPHECFTPLTIPTTTGRRTLDLTKRDHRITAYAWLLHHGNETLLFEYIDAALLIDAWPDLTKILNPEIRQAWSTLVARTTDRAIDEIMIADFQRYHATKKWRPISRTRLRKLIHRLADRGLTPDQIRDVLRKRQTR